MSIFAYPNCKVIDEVTFRTTANGATRAYIHACPEIAKGKVEEMLKVFKSQDIECIPFTVNDKPVVEVRGFDREGKLLKLLADHGFIEGTAQITKEKADHVGWGEKLRTRSLQASGASMMVADIGYAIYGLKSKHWEDAVAGLSYLSGSILFTVLGRNDQSSLQIREGAQLILDHAKQKGYDVSEDTALSTVGARRKETVVRQAHNFLKAHPSEVGNMMYVLAGGLIAKSALQHRYLATPRADMTQEQIGKMRSAGLSDTLLGMSTIASGSLATFVKEKARDPDAPRKHGLAGIVEWIQEKPLRLASYGYIGSTLCHAYSTWSETKEARRMVRSAGAPAHEVKHAREHLKALPFRTTFVAFSLLGELLMSISSKGHGEGVVSDNTVDDSIVAVAAELIIKQPKHMQEDLIHELGKFLGRPEVLALKDEDAVIRLRKQVEEMRCNPWATKIPEAAPEALHLEKSASSPIRVAAPRHGGIAAWQKKVSSIVDKTVVNQSAG